MSDLTPDPLSPLDGPTVSGGTDELTPPDDFGAAVLAEFERRDKTLIAGSDGEAIPAAEVAGEQIIEPAEESAEESPQSAPQPTGDSPDGAPEVEVPIAASQEEQSDDGAVESPAGEPAPSGGYAWTYDAGTGEQTVQFTDEQVQRAIALAAWAENLPDEARIAMGAIETGAAVAISRADYDEFRAFQAQRERSTRDADLDSLDVDPEVAKVITALRDEVSALKGGAPGQPALDPQQQTINANLDATAAAFDQATASYAAERGLTAEEAEQLLRTAVEANVIPALSESHTQRHPMTGAPLGAPDIAAVTRDALDFALVRNPALHSRVLAGEKAPDPPAPAAPAADPVVAKRARAGSLAAAPSAATAPAPRNPASVSDAERVAAMAKDLEAALAGNQ